MRCTYSDIQQLGERTVDQYFVLENNGASGIKKKLIIPDCTPGIVYIEKGNFSRRMGTEKTNFSAGQLILFGQKTKSVEYQFNDETLRAIGFKLMPNTIYSLFGISASEITDAAIELKELCKDKDRIIDNLHQHRIDQSLIDTAEIPALLNRIIEDIHKHKGLISIQELSAIYNIGYKRMQRLFKLHVGITPKLYTRIIRFNNSVSITQQPDANYTDLAYRGGYYDQNHFIKESKAFTGLPPSYLLNSDISCIEEAHLAYLKARRY